MDDHAGRKLFDYIIKHVQQKKDNGFAPDLVFVTGDLGNKGKDSEYETFWSEFMEPLSDVIGGNIANHTFVIPGNHDVDRNQNPAFSRKEIADPKSHYFDPTDEGQKLRKMLIPRFRAFTDVDLTVVAGGYDGKNGGFVKTIDICGTKVAVVGINTAWLCKGDDDDKKLTPGKPLLEGLLATTSEADLRIVLGHHPLDWLVPAEQKPIKSVLAQHAVLYLHGHLHDAWAEPDYGGGNEFLSIQSGAAFQAREGEKWRNGIVWGEADLAAQEARLQPWRWTPDHQAWTLASDAFPENHRKADW